MNAGRRSFTLLELLVVIAILGGLAAMLLPVLGKSREEARRTACANNLKQLGTASLMYADDFDGWLPDDEPIREFSPTEYPHGDPNDIGSSGLYDGSPWNLHPNNLYWYSNSPNLETEWTSGFAVAYMYTSGNYEGAYSEDDLGPLTVQQSQLRDRREDDPFIAGSWSMLGSWNYLADTGDFWACPSSRSPYKRATESSYYYTGKGFRNDGRLHGGGYVDPGRYPIGSDYTFNHPGGKWKNAIMVDGHSQGFLQKL